MPSPQEFNRAVTVKFRCASAYQLLAMPKLVVLKLDDNLIKGVRVSLEIGAEEARPAVEIQGFLPPKPEIAEHYGRWQSTYRSLGDFRIKPIEITISSSRAEQLARCRELAAQLSQQINSWLNSESFRKLKETLLEQLMPSDTIRFLIKTDDIDLRRLPWYCWDIFERYPKAEIALSPATSIKPAITNRNPAQGSVKILAILGNSQKIDIEQDRIILAGLPSAEVTFLVEPSRRQIGDQLWEKSWDILFFAGHSSTRSDGR